MSSGFRKTPRRTGGRYDFNVLFPEIRPGEHPHPWGRYAHLMVNVMPETTNVGGSIFFTRAIRDSQPQTPPGVKAAAPGRDRAERDVASSVERRGERR